MLDRESVDRINHVFVDGTELRYVKAINVNERVSEAPEVVVSFVAGRIDRVVEEEIPQIAAPIKVDDDTD